MLCRFVSLLCTCDGNAGNFSTPPRLSDRDMHHGTCVTHVPRCMPGSLTSGFLWGWGGENVPVACATRNFTYLVVDFIHDMASVLAHIMWLLCLWLEVLMFNLQTGCNYRFSEHVEKWTLDGCPETSRVPRQHWFSRATSHHQNFCWGSQYDGRKGYVRASYLIAREC